MPEQADTKTPGGRPEFMSALKANRMAPLWEVFRQIITPSPQSGCRAHLWRYEDIRPLLLRAGELISAREAERRVLILENPGFGGESRITTSLYAGCQLVLPGEVAPAHRHSQSALRFVLEGSGGYTTVDGERTIMEFGDFIVTPPWGWHDHGNNTEGPMIWLDGLDIPLVQFLDASFFEGCPDDYQPVSRPDGASQTRYGQGLLPVDYRDKPLDSPVFNYPYKRTRQTLLEMRSSEEWDGCHGLKLRYINPVTGDYAMPRIGTFIQLLPEGFSTKGYRSTDATVFVCVEGRGQTQTPDNVFDWGPRDIFVIPSWTRTSHTAGEDAVLFSFSDRPVQEKLGLFREQRE